MEFHITLDLTISTQPLDGRVLVVVSDENSHEPRLTAAMKTTLGLPLWGKEVRGLKPGEIVILKDGNPGVFGFPVRNINDLSPGNYNVQAVLRVWRAYHRSVGSVLMLPMAGGRGIQNALNSTGDYYSHPVNLKIGEGMEKIELVLMKQVEAVHPVPRGGSAQQGNPPNMGDHSPPKNANLSSCTAWRV